MQYSDIPSKFPIPFAASAGAGYIRAIPVAHQTATATDAPASLTDGFPPETFRPLASGGVPPSGADFNGMLNRVSAWARWQAAGGPLVFDSSFASAMGGYPYLALLTSTTPGRFWQNLVDGNTTDPDGSSATNWQMLSPGQPATSNGVNGYRLHPDGYLEQWGTVAIPGGSNVAVFSFNYPRPFASIVHSVVGNADRNASGSWAPLVINFPGTNLTGTGCTADTAKSDQQILAGANVRWRAWGF